MGGKLAPRKLEVGMSKRFGNRYWKSENGESLSIDEYSPTQPPGSEVAQTVNVMFARKA